MSILNRLKSAIFPPHTVEQYFGGTIQTYDTSGINGSAYWAFDYRAAVEQSNSWVYRCAVGNAQRASSIPLKLYVREKSAQGKRLAWDAKRVDKMTVKRLQRNGSSAVRHKAVAMDDGMVQLREHPILDLLSKAPKGLESGFDMMTFLFLSAELTGNAYIYKQFDPRIGRPVGLYPMLPQWVLVCPAKEGSDQLVERYAYGQFTARHRVTDFSPEEVMHFKYPNVRSMYYGMGKVEACWDALGLARSQRIAYRAIFDNGLNPGMLMGMENLQNDSQAREAEGRLNSIMRGVRNAGKLLVVSGKANIQPLSIPPKDISTNESILEEIAACFGYPVTMLLAKDQGKANAESGETTWLRHTIDPMLRNMEQWLNQSLLPSFGEEVADNACLAFDPPIEADSAQEEASLANLVQTGIITPNEARNTLGKESIAGQDQLRIPNSKPADYILPEEQVKAKAWRYP